MIVTMSTPPSWATLQRLLLLSVSASFILCEDKTTGEVKDVTTEKEQQQTTTEAVEVETEEVIYNQSYTGRTQAEIKKIFKKWKIIPDLIDEAPEYELELRFVGGLLPDFGSKHTVDELRYSPYAVRFETEKHILYSLFMLDLDNPSRKNPTKRAYYHWGMGNIPGYNILSAETLAKYIAPFPDKGSGEHRYVFLVYKQPFGRIIYLEPRLLHIPDDTHRANFSMRELVKRYKLIGPIAGNFLVCQWTPPPEHPFRDHTIINQDFAAPKRKFRRKTLMTTEYIPPDKLEPSDVEGVDDD